VQLAALRVRLLGLRLQHAHPPLQRLPIRRSLVWDSIKPSQQLVAFNFKQKYPTI
jgi:hypothetical protein